ncbi:hypothetical protein ACTNDG_05495 [Clostridium sp. HCP1S3_B4]|uniref:hypothetical protein n=1 Tax=unclassified Clostridium TaxID=2614128 RepID=UPI0016B65854|nr:hypothetical protein [Clostridiales bacterium]MDY2728941.1 hypothetical protein [Clostridium sp.]NLK22680.1 hypothetical protein [Clostridiales bacterium]
MNRKLSDRLSIQKLADQNQTEDKNSNLEILKRNRDKNVDTYIIELDTLTAGIANLTQDNKVNVYIGRAESQNQSININEFNSKFIIMDDYSYSNNNL